MIRTSGLFLGLIAGCVASAQPTPRFQLHHFGPENGLSNRHVTALIQDRIGFVWVGTVSGLDRFDGHAFRNWSVIDGLSGGRVDALRRDAAGMVWVFSTSTTNDIETIDVMDPFRGVMRPLKGYMQTLPFDPSDVVRVGPQRDDNAIVLGLRDPARCVIHEREGVFKVIAVPGGARFEPLGADRTGNIIGCVVYPDNVRSIARLDVSGHVHELQRLETGTEVEPLITGRTSPGALYRTTIAGNDTRYFDTYSELVLNPHTLTSEERDQRFVDPVRRPLNITPLPQRAMLVEDARIYDKNDRVVFDLTALHAEVGGRVKDCMLDKDSDPWFATEFGLFRAELRGEPFERVLYSEDTPKGFGILCRGMAWDHGRLYLSTEWQGAYVVSDSGGTSNVLHRAAPDLLFATHVSENGTWWRGGPAEVWSEALDGSVRKYRAPDEVWCILDQGEAETLLGSVKGIWSLDPATGITRRWSGAGYPALDQAHVLQLTHDKNGNVLATTTKGLFRITPKGAVLDRWWSGGIGQHELPHDDLHHCYVDADGLFWLSTRGAGLVCFDPASGRHQQYTRHNGFPNNMVYAAYEDDHDQLWLPTDGGIVRFDKKTRQSMVFTMADGISHDEFNRLAHTRSPDGRLFFGGLNGVTAFDPEKLKQQASLTQYPLVFTGLMRYETEQGGLVDRTGEVNWEQGIHLTERDRSILISFALLSFEGTGRILYAWRLGADDNWTYQYEPYIRFDQLPYGTVALEVRARDGHGQWEQRTLELDIEVDEPWQAKAWVWFAGGAGVALFSLAGFALLRRRDRVAGRLSQELDPPSAAEVDSRSAGAGLAA